LQFATVIAKFEGLSVSKAGLANWTQLTLIAAMHLNLLPFCWKVNQPEVKALVFHYESMTYELPPVR